MNEHRLRPLVNPASIAVVGATQRADAVGNEVVVNLLKGQFPGPLYAINPGYDEVLGVPCFASLVELPAPVEHVIFAVGDTRIEAALDDAIDNGVRACTIFSTLVLENDSEPALSERIRQRALTSGVLLAGGNSMGFFNFNERVWAGGFDTRSHHSDGNVALLSQSGAGMSAILDCEERLHFSFAASSGQELLVGVEDYLDYVIDRPETRVIGLFLETSRQPAALCRALHKARQRGIPVLAVKVGRTDFSARMAQSHSGALAGSDSAYQAVFDHYGVQRVEDLDELATALIMFAQPHQLATGGLATLHDSGGERQLLIDLAEREHVPLAQLHEDSVRRLDEILDPGLPAVNPLDAWSTGGDDYHADMANCFATLMRDPDTALGAVVHARGPHGALYRSYRDYLDSGHQASAKPVFLVAARQGTGHDEQVLDWTAHGYPVLDGVSQFLVGVRCMLNWRDYRAREPMRLPQCEESALAGFRQRLDSDLAIGEVEAANLLADCGLPMLRGQELSSREDLEAIATTLDYPVVLKTAMPGLHHKSDQQGVILDLQSADELRGAYQQLSTRLSPRALVAPMIADPGVEMVLGISQDEQFGPLVVMGFGGIHAELLQDVTVALPPFDAAWARHCIERLQMRPLLDGLRGAPPVDIDTYCEMAARLSVLAMHCREQTPEVDINPVKLTANGCIGLDALILNGIP